MERRKRIVLVTVLFLVSISIISIVVYPSLPEGVQTSFFFYLLVVSAWTSLAGCYWALYSVWKFHGEIDRAREEISRRLGTQFIGKVGQVLERAEARYRSLPQTQQTMVIKLLDRMIDRGFSILERQNVSPQRKKVKKLER